MMYFILDAVTLTPQELKFLHKTIHVKIFLDANGHVRTEVRKRNPCLNCQKSTTQILLYKT